MRGVHVVVPEAAHHAEVLARHLGPGQRLGRQHRPLAAQDQPAREVAVEAVAPAAAAGPSAALVGVGHRVQEPLRDRGGVGRLPDVEHVVDVARRVGLRHEQRVAVPELGLHQRPVELLEAERDQLVLEIVQEGRIGVVTAEQHPVRRGLHVVRAQAALPPGAGRQDLRRQDADRLGCAGRSGRERRRHLRAVPGQSVEDRLPVARPERPARPAPPAEGREHLPVPVRKRRLPQRPAHGGVQQAAGGRQRRRWVADRRGALPIVHPHGSRARQRPERRTHFALLQRGALGQVRQRQGPDFELPEDPLLRHAVALIRAAQLGQIVLDLADAAGLGQPALAGEPGDDLVDLTQDHAGRRGQRFRRVVLTRLHLTERCRLQRVQIGRRSRTRWLHDGYCPACDSGSAVRAPARPRTGRRRGA